jgi:hypothetical protein
MYKTVISNLSLLEKTLVLYNKNSTTFTSQPNPQDEKHQTASSSD